MKVNLARGSAVLAGATGIACAVIGGGVALATSVASNPERYDARVVETLFTALIFTPLMIVAIVAARLGGRSVIWSGPGAARDVTLGLAIGLGGMAASTGDAHLAGTLVPAASVIPAVPVLVWGAAVVLVQAASEEVFFRGWLQPALARCWGPLPALVGTSCAFAIAHLAGGARAPLSLLNLLLGGLMFGLLAMRAGGIASAIGAHFGWNAAEQLLFGLDPNPGVGSFGALADRDLVGSAIWGGSAEGLNGSVVMTGVILAIVVPLAVVRRTPVGGEAPPPSAAFNPPLAPAPYRSGSAP